MVELGKAFMEMLWDDLDLQGTVAVDIYLQESIAHVECSRF